MTLIKYTREFASRMESRRMFATFIEILSHQGWSALAKRMIFPMFLILS